jgi:alkylresorcinol/alkylpyrone synthase
MSKSDAKILSIATATPPYCLRQHDIAAIAEKIFNSVGDFSRFLPVYQNAAIETRYSSVPLEWYASPSSLSERNALYLETALTLLEKVAVKAVSQAGLEMYDIDGLVIVSSSGIATPSLDALLMERMNLKRNMERLPIFGLGCAGGVIGLARAAQLAQGAPGKHYLYMVVELCGLNFLHEDRSKSGIIATALFADGASAAVISCQGNGHRIRAWEEYTWPDSLDIMGWDVTDHGLRAVFSQDIPSIVRKDMRVIVDNFLQHQQLSLNDFQHFLCHPGGAKVLDAIEEALELPSGSLTYSRDIMRRFGNMSAATAMFVLEAAMLKPQSGNYLLTAFGPGFTAALLWLSMS